jgi:hypothetical protein
MNQLHNGRRRALCFSGGGIRSATFAVGILQGLAHFSRQDGLARPTLLGEVDYLSTVSGGGYTGAWFSAWASRLSKMKDLRAKQTAEEGPKPDLEPVPEPESDEVTDGVRQSAPPAAAAAAAARQKEASQPDIALNKPDIPDRRDGSALVMHDLKKTPNRLFEPERDPLKHLRAYTNYLSPRSGVLSADAWALGATVVRNMFLNWLVLLPAIAAVLLLPVQAQRLLDVADDSIAPLTGWVLAAVAVIFGAAATAYVCFDLPDAGNARRPTRDFVRWCLLPLALSAVALILFWRWMPDSGTPAAWWDIAGFGKDYVGIWQFGVLGALMHGGGMLAGLLHVRWRFHRPNNRTSILATTAAFVTGFAGGVVGYLVPHFAGNSYLLSLNFDDPRLYACLAFPLVMSIFAFASMLLVGCSSYFLEDEDREWWARSGGWFLALAIGWLTLSGVTLYASEVLGHSFQAVSSLAAASGITGFLAARAGSSPASPSRHQDSSSSPEAASFAGKLLRRFGAKLILPLFLILFAMLIAIFNDLILHWVSGPQQSTGWRAVAEVLLVMAIYGCVCLGASWFINVNKFSLHAMYRARLIRAFLGASNEQRTPHPFTGFDEHDNMAMCALTANAPMHVVNMALNLVGGAKLAWQERKAASYTSTRLHTGGLLVGYRDSARYGGVLSSTRTRTALTLGTAITISGAAASPNMGYHSSPLLTLVMTLFNARLGWWLGNPNAEANVWQRSGPRWGIRAFFDEAFGLTTQENPWVYLSDGGHFENLGLYEMVLRRCHHIVVCDAGCDPDYHYEDLANAIRKIRIDLGIPIDFEPPTMPMSPSQAPEERHNGRHCALATIHYDAVDGEGAPFGTLIYIKPSLNGNEPADIQHYAAAHPPFPHQPTTDQFFTESQFESYRRLGYHIIEEILTSPDGHPAEYNFTDFMRQVRWYMSPVLEDDNT